METSQLICKANQLTGFYMMGTLVVKRLKSYSFFLYHKLIFFSMVSIASSLASILTKSFMDYNETIWINEWKLNKTKFYLRYADDILPALDNEEDSSSILTLNLR